MRKLTLLLTLSFSLCSNLWSQNFGIGIKDHPYYNIIEWKGNGGLLMSRSPKDILNQIGLSLIGQEEQGMWDQKMNPKVRDPYYLFNEGTRYVYFIDNLDLVNNGRAMFNQMNSAGNVKSKVLDVGIRVKRMEGEFDYNKFELINATVTEKALIYHYNYYDKKDKENHEIAVFMTHHNLQHYVFEMGYTDVESIEEGSRGQYMFAGFKGDVNYFAWRDPKTDVKGWGVRGYSSKGEVAEDHYLFEPKQLVPFRNIGYGNTGKYYVTNEDLHTMETGTISFINGHFYLVAIQQHADGNKLMLWQQDGEGWLELNALELGELDTEKDEIKFGTSPVNEGILFHYKFKETDQVGVLPFDVDRPVYQEDFNEQSVYNPSRLLIEHGIDEFVTETAGKVLVCNYKQFEVAAGISFQHR